MSFFKPTKSSNRAGTGNWQYARRPSKSVHDRIVGHKIKAILPTKGSDKALAGFLINLQKAGVRFVAADMPQVNEVVVGIMALIAQEERKAISSRTKAALAAKTVWYENLDEAAKAALIAKEKPTKLGPMRHGQLIGAAADRVGRLAIRHEGKSC